MPFLAAAAAAGLILNTATGIIQGASQLKRSKELYNEYKKQLDEFTPATRENVYRGMRVPTEREEIERQDIGASTATALSNISRLGVQGYGATSDILRNQQRALDDVAASYEEKKMRIQELIASDDRRLQNMRYDEEQRRLSMLNAGAQSALQMGEQAREGIYSSIQSGIAGGVNLALGQQEMNLTRDIYGLTPDQSTKQQIANALKSERLGYRPQAPNSLEPINPYNQYAGFDKNNPIPLR